MGVGGNRAGDEGAAALARAVRPRRNPDGSWTGAALRKLDASENAIGKVGLLALAEAVDPHERRRSFPLDVETNATCHDRPNGAHDTESRGGHSPTPTGSGANTGTPRSPSSSQHNSRPASARHGGSAHAAALARSFAATSVTNFGASVNARTLAIGETHELLAKKSSVSIDSPRGVVGSGRSSGGATPSSECLEPGAPASEPHPARTGHVVHDVHSGLRKLDLARNNSDEDVRERLNELREKLRRAPGGSACDVIV